MYTSESWEYVGIEEKDFNNGNGCKIIMEYNGKRKRIYGNYTLWIINKKKLIYLYYTLIYFFTKI